MHITLSIEDTILDRAQAMSIKAGLSLDQLVSTLLERYINSDQGSDSQFCLLSNTKLMPSMALRLHAETIIRVVESRHCSNPRVIGSTLRGEDTTESDLDILVDPGTECTLMDLAAICLELENMLGVRVDVITPGSFSAQMRERILAEALSVNDFLHGSPKSQCDDG